METRETSQTKNSKGGYFPWTLQESQLLKRLIVDGIKRGWHDSNGSISKSMVETKILPILNITTWIQEDIQLIPKGNNAFGLGFGLGIDAIAEMSQLLKRLIVDGIKQGWHDSNGSISKSMVETKILPILNITTWIQEDIQPIRKSNEIFEKKISKLCKTFPMDIQIINTCGITLLIILKIYKSFFENAIAKGNNAFGLGFGLGIDAIAEIFEVETNVQEREDVENVTETEIV
ncbi:unnamed protein product, partial [Thlaspi arvense]